MSSNNQHFDSSTVLSVITAAAISATALIGISRYLFSQVDAEDLAKPLFRGPAAAKAPAEPGGNTSRSR